MNRLAGWKVGIFGLAIAPGMVCGAEAADPPKPVTTTAVAGAEYRLGPEDIIDVFVWKEPELTTTATVRPDGKISLPLANEIVASGKTAVELRSEITERLNQFVTQPVVSVMVKQVNSLKISVLGEVRKPDIYRIKQRVTVLDAIAMAGGFTDLAKPNKVVVIRNGTAGPQRIRINVKQTVEDHRQAPFYLEPLDTVYVENYERRGDPPMSRSRKRIKVLICNRCSLFREGMKALFGDSSRIQIAGVTGAGEDAVAAAERLHPDVLLLDVDLPGLSAFATMHRILAKEPDTKVLILTLSKNHRTQIARCLESGAAGQIRTHDRPRELEAAIVAAAEWRPAATAERHFTAGGRRAS